MGAEEVLKVLREVAYLLNALNVGVVNHDAKKSTWVCRLEEVVGL